MMSKVFRFGVLAIMAAILLAGCVPKEIRTAKIELGTVKKPRQNPDIERVKANLEQALKAYPDNADVYHLWGRVYAMEGEYEKMAQSFARSEELDAKFKSDNDFIRQAKWEELFNKAKTAAQNDELETALEDFKNSAICWPERYESLINGAVVAHQLGRNDEAYALSKKAYDIAPDTIIVMENYSTMSMAVNKFDEALGVYQKLLEMDPTNAMILINIGNIYQQKSDISKAIEYFNKAVQIDESNADAWFNLGLFYFHEKDFCKAAESFNQSSTLNPEDVEAKLKYGVALYECGDYETAKTVLEDFTIAYPENCDGWVLLANSYLKLKMKKEALEADKRYRECTGE